MRSISKSLKDYARGITGGLLFSLPLLYTMEVWWAGMNARPLHLLILIAVTFIVLLGYNRYAGMHPDTGLKEIIMDSFEEMGLGLIISFLLLLLLNRINFEMHYTEITNKIIIEAMFVAIGVSVGRAQLGSEDIEVQNNKDHENNNENNNGNNNKTAFALLSVCGCIIVAGNVAPTEEIILIAFEAKPSHILFLVLLSVLIGSVILFFSDFRKSKKIKEDNIMFTITFDTTLAYLISLATSAFILWFFGRFEGNEWQINLFQVIVLGLPAMIGASAGRLLVK